MGTPRNRISGRTLSQPPYCDFPVPIAVELYQKKYGIYRTLYYSSTYAPAHSNISIIGDVIGEQNRYNPIVHTVTKPVTATFPNVDQSASTLPNDGQWRTYQVKATGGFGISSHEAYFNSHGWPTLPSFDDWGSLVNDVGSQLDGHMHATSNIIVTLGEALKTIAMLREPYKFLKNMGNFRGFESGKQTLKTIASTRLSYKYGWRQFKKDIEDFLLVYYRVSDHLRYLQEYVGQDVSVSARNFAHSTSPGHSFEVLGYTDSWNFIELDQVSTFSLRYVIPNSVSNISRKQATLDALGASKVAEALWDLVPFSFVVDWFINWSTIAKYNPLFWSSHHVYRVGYSTKRVWTVQPSVEFDWPLWGLNPHAHESWTGTSVIVRKEYIRTPGFPPSGYTGLFGNLSITNLADGAALVLQRI